MPPGSDAPAALARLLVRQRISSQYGVTSGNLGPLSDGLSRCQDTLDRESKANPTRLRINSASRLNSRTTGPARRSAGTHAPKCSRKPTLTSTTQRSLQGTHRRVALLPYGSIRTPPLGTDLVFHASAPPRVTTLQPWTARKAPQDSPAVTSTNAFRLASVIGHGDGSAPYAFHHG